MVSYRFKRKMVIGAPLGMPLAPGAVSAHIYKFHAAVAVEFSAVFRHKAFQLFKKNGVAVIRLPDAVAAKPPVSAAFLYPLGRCEFYYLRALKGAKPEGKGVAYIAVFLHNSVNIRPVIHTLGFFYIGPIYTQVKVVKPGEIGHSITLGAAAVLRAAAAVIYIVPIPALMRVF